MPNGDGECKYCGAPGTPYGIKHEEGCLFVQGQHRIDILTGKRMGPEEIKDWADGIAKECAEDTDKTTLVREEE